MSDRIPFHIQEEIMKRLPVKSLIQFRSVSKAWKSLVDSSEFIAAHSHTQQLHLLVSYYFPPVDEDGVLLSKCYMDDDNFPQHMSVPTLPVSVKQLPFTTVVGSSQGLLCLYGSHPHSTTGMAVVWNPSIRKSVVVDVPRDPDSVDVLGESSFGFGVCPVTSDPKIVVVTQFSEVMVYTLNSGKWRNLPAERIGKLYRSRTVVTDRFIYWHAASRTHKMITSFDLTSESFEVIDLPDRLAHHGPWEVQISKLRESVALLQYKDYNCSTVWIMEHGNQRLFTKLFTIKTPHQSIMGFRKNGVPIMQVTDDDDDDRWYKLVVYEPNSEHDNVLEIFPLARFFFVDSYIETLLLLDRSDCSSY